MNKDEDTDDECTVSITNAVLSFKYFCVEQRKSESGTSNLRPPDQRAGALPTELSSPMKTLGYLHCTCIQTKSTKFLKWVYCYYLCETTQTDMQLSNTIWKREERTRFNVFPLYFLTPEWHYYRTILNWSHAEASLSAISWMQKIKAIPYTF